VANPLETARYQADPCRTLTSAQVRSLGLADAAAKPDTTAPGAAACSWYSAQAGYAVGVRHNTTLNKGLSLLYRKKNEAALFQEIPPINGYPAIIFDQYADLRSQGTCGVDVGLSDAVVLDVVVQGTTRTQDPCGIAQRAAALMIDNIKGGA
jgi:hypothetical protein